MLGGREPGVRGSSYGRRAARIAPGEREEQDEVPSHGDDEYASSARTIQPSFEFTSDDGNSCEPPKCTSIRLTKTASA
jgi:hypothetical protein